MCLRFDSLTPWQVSGCRLTVLAVSHVITPGLHWDCSPLSKCIWPWLLILSPADPGRHYSTAGGKGTCGVRQKGILPCGRSCTMYPIPTRTCNLWWWQPIMATRKLVPGHHYDCPGGVLVRALIISLALWVPLPVYVDERVACLLAPWPLSANTLCVGILVLNHCIY